MREVVTLQCGQRSNYLATHFWNIQESYFSYSENDEVVVDHDVHFRTGVGADRSETFTPRTVIYDLKGGFGSLKKYNALYELADDVPKALWAGTTTIQKQDRIEQNDYQSKLDAGLPTSQVTADQVRYWSDFNRVFYHPRSSVQLNEYELNSQLMPFESYEAGQDLYSSLNKDSDILDRDVRPFVEECNQLDALQIFTSLDDAWGGFSSLFTESLQDEYGKTGIWVWGQENGMRVSRQTEIRRKTNVARCIESFAPRVSALIRLSSPPFTLPSNMQIDPASEWSKSAMLCSAVESMTLPDRLRGNGGRAGTLSDLAWLNNGGSRSIFDLKSSAIIQETNAGVNGSIQDTRLKSYSTTGQTNSMEVCYSPRESQTSAGKTPKVFGQVEVRRGLPGPPSLPDKDATDHDTQLDLYESSVALPRLDTFPLNLFDGAADKAVGVRASLSTTSEIQFRLKDLSHLIARSINQETRETLVNNLAELGESYALGWQSDSDVEDD